MATTSSNDTNPLEGGERERSSLLLLERIKACQELLLDEKTGAVKLGTVQQWYDQSADSFVSLSEVNKMSEKKRKEFLGSSLTFPKFSDEACAIVECLLKAAKSLAPLYLTTSAHSVYSASNRKEQLREAELRPVLPAIVKPYPWSSNTEVKVVTHHGLPKYQGMRIIDEKYFTPRWSEPYLDILRSLPWVNASEWIKSDERMGMVCTGIFSRVAHANRLYGHAPLVYDQRQFLCVMDDFLGPEECKSLLDSSVDPKVKKLISPFVQHLVTATSPQSSLEPSTVSEAKTERKLKPRVEKKVEPRLIGHLVIYLSDTKDGHAVSDLVFDSFSATVKPREGRAVWWCMTEVVDIPEGVYRA